MERTHTSASSSSTNDGHPAATSGRVLVNGIHIYYEAHGPDTLPLVLLHGGGSTIESTFGRVLPLFARSRRVIAIEEQAHGRSSDRDQPVTFEGSADDVAGVLDALGIARADLLGFSNGASVALHVAARHPALVEKLVFASSFISRDGAPSQFWEFIRSADLTSMPQALKDAFLSVNPDPEKLKVMHDKDAARMRDFVDVPASVVNAVRAPTLVIAGDRDVVRLDHLLELQRRLPECRLLVLPAGHGDYFAEASSAPTATDLAAATVFLIERFLSSAPA